MGYQRGERGRLASLITVIVLGTAVLGIDHISGRAVRPPARTEPANQVISMDITGASQAETPGCIQSAVTQEYLNRCQQSTRPRRSTTKVAGQEVAPATNAIKLKAQEAHNDLLVLSRMPEISSIINGLSKKPCFLELQLDSIPPLEKRLIAAASQMTSIKSVSICIDGEVRINKGRSPAAQMYLIRANTAQPGKTRERQLKPAIPVYRPDWEAR